MLIKDNAFAKSSLLISLISHTLSVEVHYTVYKNAVYTKYFTNAVSKALCISVGNVGKMNNNRLYQY